jgi:hypothetical protein
MSGKIKNCRSYTDAMWKGANAASANARRREQNSMSTPARRLASRRAVAANTEQEGAPGPTQALLRDGWGDCPPAQ